MSAKFVEQYFFKKYCFFVIILYMKKFILLVVLISLTFTNYYSISSSTDNVELFYHDKIIISNIKLEQNIYSYKNTTVDKNIIYLKESNPLNDFYILAAHSGNSSVAYFKNIYKLNKDDNITLIMNNKIMTYKVEKMYYVEKVGNIKIFKNDAKDTLYLTTCDKFNNKRQLVIKCVKKM